MCGCDCECGCECECERDCEFECGVVLRDVAWLTLLYWSALHSILSMREALSFSLDILIYTIFLSYIIFPFLFSLVFLTFSFLSLFFSFVPQYQQQFLSVLIVLTFLLILPFIFDFLARNYEGMKLESEIQNSIMTRYFYYQLINVYVTVGFGGSNIITQVRVCALRTYFLF